jgi:hypothetical protein
MFVQCTFVSDIDLFFKLTRVLEAVQSKLGYETPMFVLGRTTNILENNHGSTTS